MKPEQVIAIIPARGGSKGLPGKNLRRLAGQPLIAHTIHQARAASCIERVVVSTDDDAIAALAQASGAQVIRRPAELAGDTATSERALVHVLERLEREERYVPELVVFLQCTSPLRRPQDIDEAVATLRRERADSLFSACRAHPFVWERREGGLRSATYDWRRRPRRQELPEQFVENGSIYVTRAWLLRQSGNRLGGKIAVYEMSPMDSIQVDTEDDWRLLELAFGARQEAASVPAER